MKIAIPDASQVGHPSLFLPAQHIEAIVPNIFPVKAATLKRRQPHFDEFKHQRLADSRQSCPVR